MAKQLQLRRGTTTEHSSFTGAAGEVTLDTDKDVVVAHDGSTAGGKPHMSASGGTFTGAVTAQDVTIEDGYNLKGYDSGNNLINVIPNGTAQALGTADSPSFAGMTITGDITATSTGGLDINLGTTAGDDFTIDTSTLVVEGDTGKVGIGTEVPSAKFEVEDGGTSTGSVIAKITQDDQSSHYGFSLGNDTYSTTDSNGMMFHQMNNGDAQFYTGGNNFMVADVSGNVGIGTTAPQKLLEVSAAIPAFRLNSTEGNVGNTDILGEISWKSADAGRAGDPAAAIRAISSTADGSHTDMAFFTGEDGTAASEKMRLDSSGRVGIGTTSLLNSQATIKSSLDWDGSTANSAPLRVTSANQYGKGAIAVGGNDNCGIYIYDSGSGLGIQSRADMNFYCQDVNDDKFDTKTRRMTIANNGNIGVPGNGTAIYNASDKRLKENINDLSGCLAKVNQLKGVSFNWIEGFCDDSQGRTEYGFIAQDVQDIDTNLIYDFSLVPVEVTTLYKEGDDIPNDKEIGDIKTETIVDKPLRINEKFIVPMLLEAVKELSAKNDTLEVRVIALELDTTSEVTEVTESNSEIAIDSDIVTESGSDTTLESESEVTDNVIEPELEPESESTDTVTESTNTTNTE